MAKKLDKEGKAARAPRAPEGVGSAGMTRYVALLRGINVGGKNLIRMSDLKACFEANGFVGATTYIASGNVLFASDEKQRDRLTQRIEEILTKRFGYTASVVLRSQNQMRDTVRRAPAGFGESPDYRYDVIFLKEPVTAEAALEVVPTREGVDEVHGGPGVLYYSRLAAKAAQSKLTRVIGMPIYKSMTIRNWNTTTRLVALMDVERR
jgi:uncharacterized protein (DUF1697 family)